MALRPFAIVAVFGCGLLASAAASSQTLKAVKERGAVSCGVSQGVIGFSAQSEEKAWTGIDADFCRALAAAIFDDTSKVEFVPLSADERFQALQAKTIDVLSRNSTWTMARETELGLLFAGVNFYDGQGFLVRHARNMTSALELTGSKICVQSGTTTELNLRDYFAANGMRYEAMPAATLEEALAAYIAGRCDVLTADASALHGERLKTPQPADHDILPEIISKEPLGPAVRQDDVQWFNIVKWVNFAMLDAEELGVSSETIDAALTSANPEMKRLVGVEGNFGEQLGLTRDWAVRIIRRVGNYAEVYDRNIGVKSKLGIPRGINQLWTSGGILYAPPIR
ncbi:MAG: amino acid ABC transporter substrate-binding protein [Alphaproteobacteria bacterium]